MTKRTVLFIIGMHRSATSALAGAVIRAGLAGPIHPIPAAVDNRRGTFEALEVVNLNDKLLSRMQRQWFHCRKMPPIEFKESRSVAERILVQEFPSSSYIVVKDPRISLLLPFWLEAARCAGMRPVVAVAIRAPQEVAQSLLWRDGIPRDHAIACWARYMLEAERSSRNVPRAFVDAAEFVADPEQATINVLRHLGIAGAAVDVNRISAFVDAKLLNRGSSGDAPVPSEADEVACIFSRFARGSETAADCGRLDELRQHLDAQGDDLDARIDRDHWAARRRKRPLSTRIGFQPDGLPRAWLRAILFRGGQTHPRRIFRRVVMKKNGALRPAFHRWIATHQPMN